MSQEVLIVGAGPTGLALAIALTRLGVKVRIIDHAAEPGTASRALVVHARTLELYRQAGIVDEFLREGRRLTAINLWARGKRVGHVAFGDMGQGLSPYPYAIILAQDVHERVLIRCLGKLGVTVERPVDLAAVDPSAYAFVAGCDGARSKMRERLGVGFPGGTYEQLFYVADLQASGVVNNGEIHVAIDDNDFLGVFPLQNEKNIRLIGTVREQATTWSEVSAQGRDRLGIQVQGVNWFSTYHVHHRVAAKFREGKSFLLGDAAHIHSPVGGQGLNTGVGDAFNLAWKLADVIHGRASAAILDTYEVERRAFAERLVNTTDRIFTLITRPGALASRVRLALVPRLVPAVFSVRAARRWMFKTISQIGIHYRMSRLSQGRAGDVYGGDRLPWVEAIDNHKPLEGMAWQVHVYGEPVAAIRDFCAERRLPLHVFPWHAPFGKNAAYLIRPDGYVASAGYDTVRYPAL